MEGDMEGVYVGKQVKGCMAHIELMPHFRVPALDSVFS